MFEVEDEITFDAHVEIKVPGKATETVKARYRVLDQDALEELSGSDVALLDEALITVEGIARKGEPLTGDEAKQAALKNSLLVAGLSGAYMEARSRNFRQGKSARRR